MRKRHKRNRAMDIMRKYLSEDGIKIAELQAKADDVGYYFWNGFVDRKTGKLTHKGRIEIKNHNRAFDYHWKKDRGRTYNEENIAKVKRELRQYSESDPNVRIFEGLTESEKFAVMDIYYHGEVR